MIEISEDIAALFLPGRLNDLTYARETILSTVQGEAAADNRRFEGAYGRFYSRVIQTSPVRRAVFSLWGSADPLYDLDAFVTDAARAAPNTSTTPVLVDLPSGSGTLLPQLAREGFEGTVLEVDRALSMLQRAVDFQHANARALRTVFLHADALDLPLRGGVADVVVSVNGLHVVPDHARFLAEAARITKLGGKLWLITPVDGPSVRSRAILSAARRLRITPQTPPTLALLRTLLNEAGYREFRSYGGTSIAGLACERV